MSNLKTTSRNSSSNNLTKKAKLGLKPIAKKPLKLSKLSLESIPEDLGISIEQTELFIYLSDLTKVSQYKLIKDRLLNIVNNLEEKIVEMKQKVA